MAPLTGDPDGTGGRVDGGTHGFEDWELLDDSTVEGAIGDPGGVLIGVDGRDAE